MRDDRFLMEQIAPLNRDPRVFYHEESNGYIMLLYLDKSDYAIFRSEGSAQLEGNPAAVLPGHVGVPELFELPVEEMRTRKNGSSGRWKDIM